MKLRGPTQNFGQKLQGDGGRCRVTVQLTQYIFRKSKNSRKQNVFYFQFYMCRAISIQISQKMSDVIVTW